MYIGIEMKERVLVALHCERLLKREKPETTNKSS